MQWEAGLSKEVILPGKSEESSKELNSLMGYFFRISRTVEYPGIYPLLSYPKDYCYNAEDDDYCFNAVLIVRTIKTEALQIHWSSGSSLGSIPPWMLQLSVIFWLRRFGQSEILVTVQHQIFKSVLTLSGPIYTNPNKNLQTFQVHLFVLQVLEY